MKNMFTHLLNANKKHHTLANDHGFTLLEMLIALAIFGILTGSLYYVMNTYSKTFTSQDVRVITQQTMRAGLDLMVRDIRLAGLNPKGVSNVGIQSSPSPTNTTLSFSLDRDEDGLTNGDYEIITYRLNGSALEVTFDNIPDTFDLLENVTSFQFSYFDETGTDLGAAPAPENIRSVGILVSVDEPAGQAGTISRTMTTQVLCRNLTYN